MSCVKDLLEPARENTPALVETHEVRLFIFFRGSGWVDGIHDLTWVRFVFCRAAAQVRR
jgi:hypothetical protein